MKLKICIVSLVLFFSCQLLHAQINFFNGEYKQALKAAKEQKKGVFIDFYATWCRPCKAMDSLVFSLKHIGDYFNERYISIKIDAEKQENLALAKQYAVTSFPMMIFLNADGKEVKRIKSALRPADFMEEVQGDDQPDLEEMYAQYKKDKNNLEIQQQILVLAPMFVQKIKGYDRDKWAARIESLFSDYVKNKSFDQMINEADFMILTTYHTEATKEDKIFDFIAANYTKFCECMEEKYVAGYLMGLHTTYVVTLCKKGDQNYKKSLERIDGDLKAVYANMDFGSVTPRQAYTYMADGTYYLYKLKDNAKFIVTMNDYFKALGKNSSVNDYTSAIEDLYTVNNGQLKTNEYHEILKWCETALQMNMQAQLKARLLIIQGDAYKATGNQEKFKQAMNLAFLISAEITDPYLKTQVQSIVKSKLAEL